MKTTGQGFAADPRWWDELVESLARKETALKSGCMEVWHGLSNGEDRYRETCKEREGREQ